MNRRDRIERGRASACASAPPPLFKVCAFAAWFLLAARTAQGLPALDPVTLMRQISSDSACTEAQALGPCYCGPFACGVRVTQFVPVAFIETTRAPGDSIFSPARALALPGGTIGSALSMTDNTAEAHVWLIPDDALPPALCPLCKPTSAARPVAPTDAGAAVCGPVSVVADAVMGGAASLAGDLLARLAYASELDAFNWRTGCRDLLALPASGLACALAPASAIPGGDCLGQWGPLKPRQMRDIGPSPLLHSAKTAIRAMSIARTQLGAMPYPVDTAGKLQQAYPVVSACFGVGRLPLPQAPTSDRPVLPSADGRYGWVYWRRTTCCARATGLAQCLAPVPSPVSSPLSSPGSSPGSSLP
jgi:hypothetical protein